MGLSTYPQCALSALCAAVVPSSTSHLQCFSVCCTPAYCITTQLQDSHSTAHAVGSAPVSSTNTFAAAAATTQTSLMLPQNSMNLCRGWACEYNRTPTLQGHATGRSSSAIHMCVRHGIRHTGKLRQQARHTNTAVVSNRAVSMHVQETSCKTKTPGVCQQ